MHYMASQLFLERYYMHKKIKVITSTYEQLIETYRSDPTRLDEDLDKLTYDRSLNIAIVPRESSPEARIRGGHVLPNVISRIQNGKVLEETDAYTVSRINLDRVASDIVLLSGSLPGDPRSVLIYVPLASIRDSVRIIQEFLVASAVITGIIGLLLSIATAGKLTKPIVALTRMSSSMKSLDFSTRFAEDRKDEIQELGENMNALSTILDRTLTELKAKNNRLALDIHQKQRLDDMRRAFLQNASHQLKTPIAIIKGYAEGLMDGIADDEKSRSDYASTIYREAERMDGLVRKLLKIARLEADGSAARIERFDLDELLKETITSFEPLFEQAQIRCRYPIQEQRFVYADRSMIAEALSNYLSNAIHHVDEHKTIEISAVKLNSGIRVDVYNSGRRIHAEETDNIWRPFYMLDHEDGYEGDGLGLSIVAAIMRVHNRNYGVDNRDRGVSFWFELETDV
jgi:signal transduction histidine kinase